MTKAIIPANLDLDALLAEHPPAFKYKKDKFLVLLGIMTWAKTKDKSKHDDKYVILHSPLLQKKVHDYADYMRYLVEHEVLISDGQYIVGEKSKGYWYHPQYATAPTGQTFELDELCTFIGNKNTPVWVAYAINRVTRQVAVFNIGNRSNHMLSKVTEPLIHTVPLKIYTDKLLQYKKP